MANKEYIERLQMVIRHRHECDSRHVESVPVHEVLQSQTEWKGVVEVFDLIGHPKTKRCYAWTYGDAEEFITVLEIPPVVDAQSAVKVGVVHQIKEGTEEVNILLRGFLVIGAVALISYCILLGIGDLNHKVSWWLGHVVWTSIILAVALLLFLPAHPPKS